MKSFKQLLDPRVFTATYRAASSIGETFFTDTFFVNTRDINSDLVQMIKVSATNTPGPGNTRGSAARVIQPKGASELRFNGLHYFTEMIAPGEALHALREPESELIQEKGEFALELQNEEMAARHRLFKECALRQIMLYGGVYMDGDGNLLEPEINGATGAISSPSGAVIAQDYGVPDSHRGDLGDIIDLQWDDADAKIGKQLDKLRRQARIDGAPVPDTIYVNGVKKSALRANTEFNDWAKYNSVRVDQVLLNDGIDGLWGFNWRFVDGTFVDPADGSTRDLIPKSQALIVPGTDRSWLRAHNLSELIPSTSGVVPGMTFTEAVQNTELVYGSYAYPEIKTNPLRLSLFYGDNFGLNFADTNAVWVATVFDDEASGSGA